MAKIKITMIYITFFFLLYLNCTYANIIKRNTYYIRLSSSPFVSPPDHIEAQHTNFYKGLKKLGIEVKISHTFKRYANGIAIETDERHLKRIAEIEHVESIEPVRLYERYQPNKPNKKKLNKRAESGKILVAPNNDINSVHEITSVKKVYEELGLTGKGVKVGIIDTGIDYRHPALGGCFGPGCRIAYGYNFDDNNNDPFDCNGHGTHVAGIIGGIDPETGFKGVASNVIFGAYKVAIKCTGSAVEVQIMRAIEKAVDDGMEVINMSIGGPGNARSSLSLMIDNLAKYKGIIFMIAIGNDGMDGISTSYDAGVASNAIGVGSFEANKVLYFKSFDTKNPKFVLNYMKINANAFPFEKAKIKLLKCLEDYKEFNNTIILIDLRDNIKCDTKISVATLKVLGFMLIQSKKEEPLPSKEPFEESGALIHPDQADIVIKYLKEHPDLELDFSNKYGYMEEQPFAVTPSIFSSWGLTDELDIKPDIGAPGGNILSAFPLNVSTYQIESGTSMSAPYMSGVAALYIEIFGKQKSFEQLKTAFMNYAIPHKGQNKLLSPVLHQGAGLVNIYDTLKATSFVYPSKINLNDTVHFNKYHTLNIYNVGRKEMKYKLSHVSAPSVNAYKNSFARNYFELEYLTNNYASVEFEKDLITVAPGAIVKVSVTFTPPNNLSKDKHWFYSGWLKVSPLDEKMPVMTIPYAGLADDARRLPLFQTPEFPRLANITAIYDIIAGNYDNNQSNITYTYTFNNMDTDKPDVPIIISNLATPTHVIFIEVLDYNYKFLGTIPVGLTEEYNSFIAKSKKSVMGWNGIIYNGSQGKVAPNGEYFIRLKALKLFGDVNNENDYEVWVSPKFKIERSGNF